MDIIIGKIVTANAHTDYVCQIYGVGEIDPLPRATDHAYGDFVAVELESTGRPEAKLVGVIYNTMLVNPDYGNLGPRLSTRDDAEIFTPDYLSETATLVGIALLGWFDDKGLAHQGVPPLAAAVNAPVWRLNDEEIRRFHSEKTGRFSLRYMPFLMQQGNPLLPPLMVSIVDRLALLYPEQEPQLAVVRNNLAWQQVVQTTG